MVTRDSEVSSLSAQGKATSTEILAWCGQRLSEKGSFRPIGLYLEQKEHGGSATKEAVRQFLSRQARLFEAGQGGQFQRLKHSWYIWAVQPPISSSGTTSQKHLDIEAFFAPDIPLGIHDIHAYKRKKGFFQQVRKLGWQYVDSYGEKKKRRLGFCRRYLKFSHGRIEIKVHPKSNRIWVTLYNRDQPIEDKNAWENFHNVLNAFFYPLTDDPNFFDKFFWVTVHVNQDRYDRKYLGRYRRVEVFRGVALASYQRKTGAHRREIEYNLSHGIQKEAIYRKLTEKQELHSLYGHKSAFLLMNSAQQMQDTAQEMQKDIQAVLVSQHANSQQILLLKNLLKKGNGERIPIEGS